MFAAALYAGCQAQQLIGSEAVDRAPVGLLVEVDVLERPAVEAFGGHRDLELVRTECLEQADAESVDSYEREHVTPFVYRRPDRYRLANLVCPFGNFSSLRLALETRDLNLDAAKPTLRPRQLRKLKEKAASEPRKSAAATVMPVTRTELRSRRAAGWPGFRAEILTDSSPSSTKFAGMHSKSTAAYGLPRCVLTLLK